MKGYRTPSWFRTKGLRKKRRVKAESNKPKTPKSKKAKGERQGSVESDNERQIVDSI